LSSAKNKKNPDWLLADKTGFSLFLIGRKPESGKVLCSFPRALRNWTEIGRKPESGKVHGSFPHALRSWTEIGRKQRAGKLKRKKESR